MHIKKRHTHINHFHIAISQIFGYCAAAALINFAQTAAKLINYVFIFIGSEVLILRVSVFPTISCRSVFLFGLVYFLHYL